MPSTSGDPGGIMESFASRSVMDFSVSFGTSNVLDITESAVRYSVTQYKCCRQMTVNEEGYGNP